jgi:hypothetical protein
MTIMEVMMVVVVACRADSSLKRYIHTVAGMRCPWHVLDGWMQVKVFGNCCLVVIDAHG